MIKSKLINGMDENTWNKFISYCKIKQFKPSEKLAEILEEFLKDKINVSE